MPTRRLPRQFDNPREANAWMEMLSRIGQRNSQLFDHLARYPLAAQPRSLNIGNSSEPARGGTRSVVIQELERERSRIARDLHAGAGQPLAGIKLNLEMLGDCATSLPEAGREALARLQSLADQALEQVRAVSHKLHPPDWQGLTTVQAVRQMIASSGLSDRINVHLDLRELPTEPAHAVKVAIYRCAQECISNVARHSGATELRISLLADGSTVELRIEDNGRGFDQNQRSGSGIGLAAIQEHAAALDGSCDISSDGGVRVRVRLPLDPD